MTYFILRSLLDTGLTIHFVFQALLEGAVRFVLVFSKALPYNLNVAFAHFGDMHVVELKRENRYNLTGYVPGKYMYQVFLCFHLLGNSVPHHAFHSIPSVTT